MSVVRFGELTDLPEVLGAVQTRVSDRTGVARHLVVPSLVRDEDWAASPPGNTFVVVRPERFVPVRPIVTGAAHAVFDGRVLVTLWHRLYTDQALRDSNWLLRDPDGVLAKWALLLAGLHLFDGRVLLDTDESIFVEPMRLDTGFEFPNRPPSGWGHLNSAWQVIFNHRLS